MTEGRLESPVDLRVSLRLLPSDRSRRTKPLIDGFRGVVRPVGSDVDFAVQIAPDEIELAPGDKGLADLWFLIEAPSLTVGDRFELLEGATCIADGRVM